MSKVLRFFKACLLVIWKVFRVVGGMCYVGCQKFHGYYSEKLAESRADDGESRMSLAAKIVSVVHALLLTVWKAIQSVALAAWEEFQEAFQYYWSNRKSFQSYMVDYDPNFRTPDVRRREIVLTPETITANARKTEAGWTVDLPDCCVVCADDVEGIWHQEVRPVENFGVAFWSPVIAAGIGLVLFVFYWSTWLLVLTLLAGFLFGYRFRKFMPVELRFRRCSKHIDKTNLPIVRKFGDQLIVRVGKSSIREEFFFGKPAYADYNPPVAADAEDDLPIPTSIPLVEEDSEHQVEFDDRPLLSPSTSTESNFGTDNEHPDSLFRRTEPAKPLRKTLDQTFPTDGPHTIERPLDDVQLPAETAVGLQPVSWSDILKSTYDFENVISEAIILALYWLGWAAVAGLCYLAYPLREHVLNADQTMIVIGCVACFSLSFLLAMLLGCLKTYIFLIAIGSLLIAFQEQITPLLGLRMTFPDEVTSFLNSENALHYEMIGLSCLPLLVLAIYSVLRFLSLVLGRYIRLCDAAARGSLQAGTDRGGLIDLFAVLKILIATLFPIGLVAAVAASGVYLEEWQRADVEPFIQPTAIVIVVWLAFILPMAFSVLAITESANPFKIVRWIGKSFTDYLGSLLLLAVFLTLAAGAVWGVHYVAHRYSPNWALVDAIIFGLCLSQYVAVVAMNMLGLIARRNEPRLKWN